MPENFEFDPREQRQRGGTDWERFKGFLKKFGDKLSWAIIGLVVLVYLAQGVYQVNPAEVGLVKRFGRHVRTADPGLGFHLPPPFESVETVDIRSVRKIEIGYETISPPPDPRYRIREDEALMLTGDNNIAHLQLAIQYTVMDPEKFAFNIIDPPSLVKEAGEAIVRQEVVKRTVREAITEGREDIALKSFEALQGVLDAYQSGIKVEAVQVQDAEPPEPVIPAFDDVISAREDKQAEINRAEEYRNEVLPKARGEAAEILNQAEAYRAEQVAESEGETSKFLQVLEGYEEGNQEVTRDRMYMETMEGILPEINKVLLDDPDGFSFLKHMDLSELGGEIE